MVDSTSRIKELLRDFVTFSANFLTVDFLEGLSDERLKRMEDLANRFMDIFSRFKTEKDFEKFKSTYENLEINEKRLILEIIGHTKEQKFFTFLFDIAKDHSFYSIDAIVSLGQIGGDETSMRLESLLNDSKDEVYSKVLKSVIYNLKRESQDSVSHVEQKTTKEAH